MPNGNNHTFLLALSDALRAQTGVEAVGNRATQLIARQLGADRVYLVSLNPDNDIVTVTHEARRPDMPPLQGSYRSSDFPAAIRELFERTILYTDVRIDARLTELDRLSFAGLGAVGFMAASLRRGSGTMIWAAGAISTQPREWTASDVVLFEYALERTWAAIERERVEQALLASELKYRSLFDSIDQGYCLVEVIIDEAGKPVDLLHIEVNQAYERQTGLSDIVGKRALDISPVGEEWLDFYGNVALTGQSARMEYEVSAIGRWMNAYASRVGGEGSLLVAIVFEDVTKRKRREANLTFLAQVSQDFAPLLSSSEILQRVGERLAGHLHLSRLVVSEVDNPADRITVLYEWRADPLTPGAWGSYAISTLLTEAGRAHYAAGKLAVIADTRTNWTLAAPPESLYGSDKAALVDAPYLENGHWKFLLTLVRSQPGEWGSEETELIGELTTRIGLRLERARAEEAMRQSEAKYRTLFETISEGICLIERLPLRADGRRDYRFITMNPAMQTLFNIADLSGQSIRDHFPHEVEDWYDDYDRVLETGQLIRFERASEPQNMVLEISVSRVEDGLGPRLLVAMHDITARKQVEQVLKQADRRKDEFLAMLAHELRNPMSTLRSGLQILTITGGKEETSSNTIAMMSRQTDHLVQMVDDLLDVSRISQGKIELKMQRLNIVDLVAQVAESVQASYQQQDRRLVLKLPTAPIYVDGDMTRLSQVITNLLTNGVRYTEAGGQVWLSLSRQADPAGRQEALIQVQDDGIGLAAEQLEVIFELFVQVDNSLARSKGGLGVGLTLVKRLVELHGGGVEASSAGVGKGSTFTVHLPTVDFVAQRPAVSVGGSAAAVLANRLLVVDDNADAALMLSMLLTLKGYEVHTRHSGQAGLAAVEVLKPGAVLLDIGMPGMDGYETARAIRQQVWGQDVVLIALTGYGGEDDKQRVREAGFDEHLIKPVDVDVLQALLTAKMPVH